MVEISPTESLVEEREAELVSFNNPQQPVKLKGLFLNPTTSSSSSPSSNPSSIDDPLFNPANFPSTKRSPTYDAEFRWWADPQSQWPLWVEKLRPKFTHIWLKAGIFDAIMASKVKIRRDPPSLLGVARFWCHETSTFVFPWGEATVTLEDAMILGGFSVLGEPVRMKEPIMGVVGHMVSKMMTEMENFKKKGLQKVEQSMWMRHYMDGGGVGKGDEIEHIAFLSLWLSRFVLIASNGKSIREGVIQVAVRLARGTSIALAPAVLASIYRDLRLMKEHISSSNVSGSPFLAVWSPINILQVWMWERFPALRPDMISLKSPGMPRAARWSLTGTAHDSSFVMRVLGSPDEFQRRPYEGELKNWRTPSFYTIDGGWFGSQFTQDEGLRSFARCLRACELVGLDCIEQYQPHRVAMQFALDQDIPKTLPRANDTWEVAWKTYDLSTKYVKFYVPPMYFKSEVTLRYSDWWRSARKKDMEIGEKRKETQPLSNRKKKKKKGLIGKEPSVHHVLRPHEIVSSTIACSEPHIQQAQDVNVDLDGTREIEASEKQPREELEPVSVNKEGIVQHLKATEKSNEEKEKPPEEEFRPEAMYSNEEGTMKTNAGELNNDQTVPGKTEAEHKQEVMPEIEERDPMKKKELERDRKINRLKEEIASILEQIRRCESLAKACSRSEHISCTL